MHGKSLAEVLTTLALRDNELGAAGARSLALALKVNSALQELDLSNNALGAGLNDNIK